MATADMSIRNTRPMKRRPTYPGEMLREDFMPDCRWAAFHNVSEQMVVAAVYPDA